MTTMEYTTENIEKAVNMFYRTSSTQQADAHRWLTEAQSSPQAWGFVWDLLSPHRSSEVQFYAATTLHTKLLRHWSEVPADHYEPLKKRILETIVNYMMGPKLVLNRLCISLAAYIIHTVPNFWPNAFEELVSSFQPPHFPNIEPEKVIWILLEMLTVIPEEFHSTPLAQNKRLKIRNALMEVSKNILQVVEMCLMPIPSAGFDMANLTTYLHATRCASTWIQLGNLNIDDCASLVNLLINLVCFSYWNKSDPECVSPEEMDLLEASVTALTNIMQHPQTSKYKNHLVKFSADLLYKFDKILEAERTSSDPNKEVCASLYGLVIAIADTHSKVFVSNLDSKNPDEQRVSYDYLSCILKCTNSPGFYSIDESSSTLTFGFWYTLQDDILSLGTAECAQMLLVVKPYYRDLLCVMLRKSMLPINDEYWSADDKEMFRCYRQDIADTYVYCYNVLNLEMLDILLTKLDGALKKTSDITNAHQSGTNSNRTSCQGGGGGGVAAPSGTRILWNEVETCLHAFEAIAESIELENLYLPKLMITIKNIPYHELDKRVMAGALETVGAYSDWITEHPNMLENVLPLVVAALKSPDVAASATLALKDLTHSCQMYMTPYAEQILITSQATLAEGNLKLFEHTRLIYSTGKLMSVLPYPKIMEYLNLIIAPSFEEIQRLLGEEPSSAVKTSLCTKLKILSSFFNSLYVKQIPGGQKVEQPSMIVMHNTWPLYKVIVEKYCTCEEIIEELATIFKFAVTTLLEDCAPLIEDILQLILTIYRQYPQPNVLIVVKTIVIMFGNDPQYRTTINQVLQEIVNITLQLCAQLSATNQLNEKTDLLEGFFPMLAAICRKVPSLVFGSGMDTSALFQCGILCLSLPELQTLKVVVSFLVHFIAQSRETAQTAVVQTYGESLVLRILLILGNHAPRTYVEIFADLLLALNKKYCDNLSRWLNGLLAQENFPSPRIKREQKEQFIRHVLKEKANKRKLCEIVLEFTLICRGILKEDNTLP